MALVNIDDETFAPEVLNSKMPAVVDFYADWCGPCSMMAPIFKEASEEMTKVKFAKMNVDENHKWAGKFGIMSIPCIILFNGGKEIDRQTGAMSKVLLKRWITEHVKNRPSQMGGMKG